MAPVTPLPFLGRRVELEGFADALERARAGAIVLVSIRGEPGTGKSRLLEELAARAEDLDVRSAQLYPASPRHPGELAGRLDLDGLEERADPAVLLVDDAHWADATSLNTLRSLLQSPSGGGLLVVVAHRPVPAAAATHLERTIDTARRHAELIEMRLGRLVSADLAGLADAELASRLVQRSGGLPGRLDRLLRAGLEGGALEWREAGLVQVGTLPEDPETITASLRLQHLPRAHRKVVEAVSLAERPVPVAVLSDLLGQPPDDALDSAEGLVDQGLLRETPEGFLPTPGMAEALEAELGPARKSTTLGELADALVRLELDRLDPGTVGGYYLEAARWTEAAELLSEAALAALDRKAYAEAFPLVQGALAASERLPDHDPGLEGRLRLGRALCYRMLGWSDLAAEELEVAFPLLGGADRIRALEWSAQVADDLQQDRRAEVALALAEREAARLGDQGLLGELSTGRAKILSRLRLPWEADALLRRGIRLLRRSGDPDQRFRGYHNASWIAFDRAQAEEAEAGFALCAGMAEAFDSDEWRADVAGWWSRALFLSGRVEEAIAAAARAIRLGERLGTAPPRFLAHMGLAEGHALFGRYRASLESADDTLAVVQEQMPAWENAARYLRAQAMAGMGDLEQAAREADRALELCPPGIDGWRWSAKCRSLILRIEAERTGILPDPEAAQLTGELLRARSFLPALELLAVRAAGDRETGRQTVALALELGIPMMAARAAASAELWGEPAGQAAARTVRRLEANLPDEWLDEWRSLPEVRPALELEEDPDADTDLSRPLEELLARAEVIPDDLRLDTAEWSIPEPEPEEEAPARRIRAVVLGVALLVVALPMVWLAGNRTDPGPPDAEAETTTTTTTLPPIEARILPPPPEGITGTWQYRGGPERAGFSDRTGVPHVGGVYWTFETAGPIRSSPAIFGKLVLVGSDDHNLYAVDATTGTRPWRFPTDGPISSSPALDPGNIAYVGSEDGNLYALTGLHGEERWRFSTQGLVQSSPAVVDGVAYVGSTDGRLYAIETAEGGELWRFPAEGSVGAIRSSPAVAGGVVYFGSADHHVYAVDALTGEQRWRLPTAAPVLATPAVADGLVYVGSLDQNLYALVTDTGRIEWSIQTGGPIHSSAAVHDGIVYVGSFDKLLHSYDTSGGYRWAVPSTGEIRSSPVVANGIVYVGSEDGRLYAFDADSGEERWTFRTRGFITVSPAVTNGAVFVGDSAGVLYAIGPEPGG